MKAIHWNEKWPEAQQANRHGALWFTCWDALLSMTKAWVLPQKVRVVRDAQSWLEEMGGSFPEVAEFAELAASSRRGASCAGHFVACQQESGDWEGSVALPEVALQSWQEAFSGLAGASFCTRLGRMEFSIRQ